MKNVSYWLDMPYISRPSLLENIETDVVIIGGGITGVSAAYHCARAGLKTVLIEKEVIASGSAGKNGGMVVEGLSIDFVEAINRFGREEARELWMNTVEARKLVVSLVYEQNIDCDFGQNGSLYLGLVPAENEGLKKEAEERAKEGIECRLIKKELNLVRVRLKQLCLIRATVLYILLNLCEALLVRLKNRGQ